MQDVRALLMGGQACVLYGAAEFSRDTDIVLLADAANLLRLQAALDELQAETIAVPPFDLDYLKRGHAIHFRCRHPDAIGMRLDVMSILRGLEGFEALWTRRTTLMLDGDKIEVLSLPDLVRAKKTQRDKDWPMIRRLIEADYEERAAMATEEQVRFWLLESRTPEMLLDLNAQYPALARQSIPHRPLLALLPGGNATDVQKSLLEEEWVEREADRKYWGPLRKELEQLRHQR